MQWSDVEAVIPAVLSVDGRARSLLDLLVQLAQQCPGIVVRVLPQYDRPKDLKRHTFETVSRGLHGLSRPWMFYIEEDVELAADFGELALTDCENAEAEVISFFSTRLSDVGRVLDGVRFYDPGRFAFSQCVAFKREAAEAWRRSMLDWYTEREGGCPVSGVDHAITDCMAQIRARIVERIPSLVQHRQLASALEHGPALQSPTFGMEI